MPNIAQPAQTVTIGDVNLNQIMYKGQPVVTLDMIDQVHERPEGTARHRFNENRKHFIESDDFFLINQATGEKRPLDINISPRGSYLLTQTGYLMLVKSFTDDLAWKVQRELVKHYFSAPTIKPNISSISSVSKNVEHFGNLDAIKLPRQTYQLGVVYAISLSNGMVKIGQTTRPDARIKELVRSYNAFTCVLRVMVSTECTNYIDIEQKLHEAFKDKQVDGELFETSIYNVLTQLSMLDLLPIINNQSLANPIDCFETLDNTKVYLDFCNSLHKLYSNLGLTGKELGEAVATVMKQETGMDFLAKAKLINTDYFS